MAAFCCIYLLVYFGNFSRLGLGLEKEYLNYKGMFMSRKSMALRKSINLIVVETCNKCQNAKSRVI